MTDDGASVTRASARHAPEPVPNRDWSYKLLLSVSALKERLESKSRPQTASGGLEGHGDAVHAVAQPRRLWPIIENMAKMTATPVAVHFGTVHA